MCSCLSHTGNLSSGWSTAEVVPPVLSRGEGSPPVCWLLFQMQPRVLLTLFAAMFNLFAGTPYPYLCFYKAAFQSVGPQCVLVHGLIPSKVQNVIFPSAELCEITVNTFLQPVRVSLHGSTTFWCYQPLLALYDLSIC